MDFRNRLIALWWADYIYRKMNNEEARDHDWWLRDFITGFYCGVKLMRSTKQYGLVNSWQEHKMLVKAEHTYERKSKDEAKYKHAHSHSHRYVHGSKTSSCH